MINYNVKKIKLNFINKCFKIKINLFNIKYK